MGTYAGSQHNAQIYVQVLYIYIYTVSCLYVGTHTVLVNISMVLSCFEAYSSQSNIASAWNNPFAARDVFLFLFFEGFLALFFHTFKKYFKPEDYLKHKKKKNL